MSLAAAESHLWSRIRREEPLDAPHQQEDGQEEETEEQAWRREARSLLSVNEEDQEEPSSSPQEVGNGTSNGTAEKEELGSSQIWRFPRVSNFLPFSGRRENPIMLYSRDGDGFGNVIRLRRLQVWYSQIMKRIIGKESLF